MEDMTRKNVDLARDIRKAFEASGMSRFELAKQAGVSYSVIHRFIAGERDLTLGTASKVAKVLGLQMVRRS